MTPNFIPTFYKGFPRAGASNKGGMGKIGVTWPWPHPFWSKNIGVMSALSLKTCSCIPNLKSVALNRFWSIGILPPKLGVTWPWLHPFLKKIGVGHVRLVHEKMSVKFEVCSFNHFEAIGNLTPQFSGVMWPWPRPLFEKKIWGVMSVLSLWRCVSNLKPVALTIFKLLAFNPPKFMGHVTLTLPPYWKKIWGSCPYCP